MPSKHINAAPGDFADTVLMPGDPLRARFIAERWLESPRQVTDVRNMLGFTGRYRGRAVSVMAHGMGIPSASIYCTELIESYGVRNLIRVGSCGTVQPEKVKLRDVVIAMGACTDSGVNRMRFGGFDYAAIASFPLLRAAVATAARRGQPVHVGNIFSADLFYTPQPAMFATMARYDILGVEMEAAGMYAIAAEHGAQALAICTVSDDIPGGAHLDSTERETGFAAMIELALDTVAGLPAP
jgi:purine-nucleoside phosphorylase